MAGTKILGQVFPSANTQDTIYQCFATSFICTSVMVCNIGTAPTLIRVGICKGGVAVVAHVGAVDMYLEGNATGVVSVGIAGKTGDNITVRSTAGNTVFCAMGYET